jgi:hypothetical protein
LERSPSIKATRTQVRGGDGRGQIGRERSLEFRIRERIPEVSGRFPDRIVQIRRAFTDGAVKLGGDEARVPLHEGSVLLPSFQEGLLVGLVEREA